MAEPGHYDRRSLLRQGAAAFLAGAAGARAAVWGVGGGRGTGEPDPTSPVEVWVADHAAHRVVGLDRHGIPLRIAHVPGPWAVRALPGGGLRIRSWTRPDARPTVWTWTPGGEPMDRGHSTLEPPSLAGLPVPAGEIAALVASAPGRPGHWLLRQPPGVTSQAGARQGRRAVAGPRWPWLERWLPANAPGQPLRRAFRIRLDLRAAALAAGPDGGVWVGGGDRRCELRYVSASGRVTLGRQLPDVDRACALAPASQRAGGGVWIGAGGAVARLDGRGDRLPGQGGFRHIRDLAVGRG